MHDESSAPRKVDINDLTLAAEEVVQNPDADPYAPPPPPPDGRYLAKLALSEQGVQTGTISKGTQAGKGYYMVNVQATIASPDSPFDGRVLFDSAGTTVFDPSGISRAAGIIQTLGHRVERRTTNLDVARQLVKILAGNPSVYIHTRWEAYCKDCGKTVLKGEKRFPMKNGSASEHSNILRCPACNGEVAAKATIAKFERAGDAHQGAATVVGSAGSALPPPV